MNMESNRLREAMYEAASDTLENMAFMEVVPLKERRDEQKYFSRLAILSPVHGTLTLITTPQMVKEFAKDLLDPDDYLPSEDMIRDTLAELINTIAGGMMRKLTPKDEPFTLGLPEAFTEGAVSFNENFELARFEIGGQTFTLAAEGEELLKFKNG